MARAASVPGLWALGFLLLCGVCVWVRFAVGCGFFFFFFYPAGPGWGLGWACLGTVCGVVPLVSAVCGVRGWGLVSACFWGVSGCVGPPLAPRCFRFWRAVWACVLGPGLGCAQPFLAGLSGCVFCDFFLLLIFFFGCPRPGPCGPCTPIPFLSGWVAGSFFFFFFLLLPATPGWVSLPLVVGGPRHSWLGSAGGGGVWCVAVVCWWGCGWCVVWLVPRHSWRRFLCATPRHSRLGFAAGGGGRSPPLLAGVRWRRWCVVCCGGVFVGVWLVCGVVGPSPPLAEVPVCYSPPLLAGFRCRWWWAVPATPGWGPLAAVVCVVWCVVCGVWWWCVGGVVAGVWCGWSLATPGR